MSETAHKKDVPLEPPNKEPVKVETPKPKKQTGWAVVGLGKLALEEIIPAIPMTETCKLTAVVSDHPEKAKSVAEKYKIESNRIYDYNNFDSIKDADDVDVVYIVLPNNQHCEFTIRSFKAGKHVLCEKPMADTVEECEKMIQAGKDAGKKLMIAYRLRYEPYTMKAIEIMRSGELGKLKMFEATHANQTEAPNVRLVKKLGGGPVEDMGIYCLNAARYISGEEPVEVCAFGVKPEGDERFKEVCGHVTWIMKFPSGALAFCGCGFDTSSSDRLRANCDKGYLQMDSAFAYANLSLHVYKNKEAQECKYHIAPENHFAAEMEHFSEECVMGGKEARTPGEEGLKDIKVIVKIAESVAAGGAPMKI